ncbi:acyl-CoA dehydrogenase [Novosphingobium pentaromativorans US6-1]|nr:acyl-CoA dehydrogenase [Novosphingobium pentaromativorans US6-1]
MDALDDEDFRRRVRAFIAAELPPEMAARTLLGYHPHKPDVEFWTAKLNERGWAALNWPVEYGGTGWSITKRHIFDEECYLAGCPAVNPQAFHLVGPIIYAIGNDAQKEFFLPRIRSGEHFWAQGFSEPNAGSDLASLQTRAVRDGDDYIVNGQKIWTSEAQYCDWVFCLVRTSTEGKKQAGISFLLVDLKSPGITIRPIIGIEGGHVLNEVFFEDVRVPVANRIGEENKGWTYAKQLLGAERTFSAVVPRCKGLVARIRAIAAGNGSSGAGRLIDDPHFARRLAQLEIELMAHEATLLRVVAEEEAQVNQNSPTPSILKVKGTELLQKLGALAIEALGEHALPHYAESDYLIEPPADAPGDPAAYGVVSDFLYHRSATIYGGANEVQRNIIAAQLLAG